MFTAAMPAGAISVDVRVPASDANAQPMMTNKENASADIAAMILRRRATLGVASIDLATPAILRNPYRRQAIVEDLQQLYAA
jgi:hypothetical protein